MAKILGVIGAFALGIPLLLAPLTTGGVHTAAAYAAFPQKDPVPPAPVPPPQPSVRLPITPVPPPPPVPVPTNPTSLAPDQLYVIDSDVSCILMTSPTGLLKVVSESGPLKMRGKFVDGVGMETRTYKGKYLYLLENPGTAGQGSNVDVMIIPSGATTEKDIIRTTVTLGSAPPPVPPTPVPPTPPNPPSDPLSGLLQAAYTADTGVDKANSLAFLQIVYMGLGSKVDASGIKINQDLFKWLKSAVESPGIGLTPTQIEGVRKVLATELINTFSASPSAPVDLAKVKTELVKIATALAKVK